MSLAKLEADLREGLDYLDFPKREWVVGRERDGREVLNVVIVGGGQSGLAAAYGLRREKVNRLVVLDRRGSGRPGPWTTFARMVTLRTPKLGSGLDFGNPHLTPQAWYTAKYGAEAWQAMGKMPTRIWDEYLEWYRRVLDIPVRQAEVTGVRPDGEFISVDLAGEPPLLARKVVLATGLEGGGRWSLPPLVARLPRERYAHTEHPIDFTALRGKRVGVLGGGASAFDNAAMALEHGARSVDLCIRARQLPRINPFKWMEFPGFLAHYSELDDAMRWAFMRQVNRMLQPPPQDTLWRCNRHRNFRLRTASPWLAAHSGGDAIVVRTPDASLEFDFLIFGTGLVNDLAARPELAAVAPHAAIWQDRYQPPPEDADDHLGHSPYLGPGFELTEKTPGAAPWLRSIHLFTHAATPSMGLSAASITGMKYGIRKLVCGVTRGLFLAEAQAHLEGLRSYSELEISTLEPPLEEQKTGT